MAITSEQDLLELLGDLVRLDYDAIDAYDVAIDRLSDPTASSRLRELRADHERHVRELSEAIVELGGEPPRQGDYRKVLAQGRVYLASLTGTTAILKAMRANEEQILRRWEEAVEASRDLANPRLREVLERSLADERRHRSWLQTQIH